ncbi:MAG: AmpG family muropeptide MFS transporter [Deltaproteobacteria bacterium]|nr:AmpG family muropeptide MFS transporter [Deltaproteobacteria bacterium]
MSLNRKLIIVSILYFAEGFPFGILEQTLPVYFRIHGMSLTDMGLLTLVSLPYALKFLWAPAVDFLGTRRQWITAAQYVMAACMLALVTLNPSAPTALLWATLGSLAILSATQDIAIDAYSIEMLRASEMGIANGFRQAAYRVAMVVAGGLFVALGGWVGWQFTFVAAGVVLCICALISLKLPPVEVKRPSVTISTLIAPLRDLLTRQSAVSVAAFILLYKLGDMAIGPMVRPFWLAGNLTTDEIGFITGTFGILSAILGGLAGGLFMARFGIFHGLWFLGLWQSLSNLSYAFVAAYPETGKTGIYAASVVESFCGGLGTAAFLAFLMSICRKEFSATQYALLSALFRVAGIIAGAFSGWATTKMGYAQFFALTFLLSLPAFLFIFKARRWIPINNGASHSPEQIAGPRPPDLTDNGSSEDRTRLPHVSEPLGDRHSRYPDRRGYGSQQAYQ